MACLISVTLVAVIGDIFNSGCGRANGCGQGNDGGRGNDADDYGVFEKYIILIDGCGGISGVDEVIA